MKLKRLLMSSVFLLFAMTALLFSCGKYGASKENCKDSKTEDLGDREKDMIKNKSVLRSFDNWKFDNPISQYFNPQIENQIIHTINFFGSDVRFIYTKLYQIEKKVFYSIKVKKANMLLDFVGVFDGIAPKYAVFVNIYKLNMLFYQAIVKGNKNDHIEVYIEMQDRYHGFESYLMKYYSNPPDLAFVYADCGMPYTEVLKRRQNEDEDFKQNE